MAEESTHPEESPSAAPPPAEGTESLRSRIRWGLVALAVLAVAVGVLAYQNIGRVPVRVFWWEFSIPLVIVIAATAIITLVINMLVTLVGRWRRHRRRHDFERAVRHHGRGK